MLSHSRVEFYRHSGRVNAARLMPAVAGTLGVCLVLEALYSALSIYAGFAAILSVAYTAFNCVALCIITSRVIRWAQVRNNPVGGALGLLIGGFALGASWLIWLRITLARFQVDVTFLDLVLHPRESWDLIVQINQIGTWTLGDDKTAFSGIPLWGVWAVEAAAMIVSPMVTVRRFLRNTPFCEHCVKWGSSKVLAKVKPLDDAAMHQRIMEKDFACLEKLENPSASMDWARISMEGCTECESAPLLTVERVKVSYSNKGHRTEKVTAVMRHLILHGEESTALIMACANLADQPPLMPNNPRK